MKLRGNKLKPLRFDPSGAYLEALGIRECDVNRVAKELESIRDSIASSKEPDSFETAFYNEPKRLLLEYQEDRHGSELAKLFKVANRMHAAVDRVVVIGIDGVDCGARSFLDGCCQPYWNELSRGSRGSKPRIYFDGNNFDNDATQGLLNLLGATEGRPSTSELDAWGLIVVGDGDETIAALGPFLRALKASCAGDLSKVQQRLVAITGSEGPLRRELNEFGCRDFFPFPNFKRHHQSFGFTALTAVGLVPAAMLGINVIELLLGAVTLNDHFEKAPAEDNSVLRFTALNSLLASHPFISGRVVSPLNQSLEGLRGWYERLLERGTYDSLGPTSTSKISANQSDSAVAVPIPWGDTTASGITPAAHIQAPRFKVPLTHHFVVEEYRFDYLATADLVTKSGLLNSEPMALATGFDFDTNYQIAPEAKAELGIDSPFSDRSLSDKGAGPQSLEQTLPRLYRSYVAKLAKLQGISGIPTTNLFVPQVDELHIGQLMQMLMVSTVIERFWQRLPGSQ
ncbi:MAG: hypothetical protein NTW52_05465 [Planctomycetota bacterium]|nr:hypothetical protein [Planctomycetota bacterium]